MNWDSYRYFLAVAETGSLSSAARLLSVSQPTVGRQIAELEDRLGTRLFERASHGYKLTLAGKQIFSKVRDISAEIGGVDRRIEGLDKDFSGSVRISATEGFGAYWVTRKLAELQQMYPQIVFELFLDIVVLDTRKREADIAIRLANPKSSALVGRRVGKVGFGLYGSKGYLDQYGTPNSIGDLQNHKFIDWHFKEKGFALTAALANLIEPSQVVFRTDTVAAQIEAILQGVGLILAPHYMVPKNADILRLLEEDIDQTEDLWILTHRDLQQTTRIRAVIDYLTNAIKFDADYLEHG
ncbi:MAG: LysR family transcriptional regulator [Sneathiella sp.]|nr:LysR family transcriptional regulator [Sneathiella sp.]